MLQIHKSADRGRVNHGWLQSNHSFSFGHYYNPEQMGFGPLLVINEDRVQPGQGFGAHGHKDMEIISYVLDDALEHKDSMGHGSGLRYGDVQRISAGTGMRHSEFNHSSEDPVHFLQIWIEPSETGGRPAYEEKHFDLESKLGKLRLIVSPDGREGSVSIRQDATIEAGILNGADRVEKEIAPGRGAYVHLIRGRLEVNGVALSGGDALKISGETRVVLDKADVAEVLVFDLPY
ncbi:MAG: pirin family protein [Candidatus Protistobacter heckmanni]|nr:pirin family protein [Candidatus Protistobacter heckmanni]